MTQTIETLRQNMVKSWESDVPKGIPAKRWNDLVELAAMKVLGEKVNVQEYLNQKKEMEETITKLTQQVERLTKQKEKLKNEIAEYKSHYEYERGLRARQLQDEFCDKENQIDKLRIEIRELDSLAQKTSDEIYRRVYLDFCNYIDNFFNTLKQQETAEGRDILKRVQLFMNSTKVNTVYDNTAYIRCMGLLLATGDIKAGDIAKFLQFGDEEVKHNFQNQYSKKIDKRQSDRAGSRLISTEEFEAMMHNYR